MKSPKVALFIAFLFALISSCSPVKFSKPNDTLMYDPKFNISKKTGLKLTSIPVSGVRGYMDTNYNDQIHTFSMNEDSDKIVVVIDDEDGVKPGSSFRYNLQVIDNVTAKTLFEDILITDSPSTLSNRVSRFEFTYSLASGSAPIYDALGMRVNKKYSPTSDNPTASVKGIYIFNSDEANGRYISLELQFKLSDQVKHLEAYPLAELSP
jgi:hypothetical protein